MEGNSGGGLGRLLMCLGVLLFLLGLLTGFAVPALAQPRMGLSSHMEGVVNGLFLIAIGLVWPHLALNRLWAAIAFALLVYGTFANWFATLLSAYWGAVGTMPLAGGGAHGTPIQEHIVFALLVSLSFAMVAGCILLLAGLLRRK
ncbi:MAG TPA: hypothetical protein VLC74_05495 [Rhizomicrobium sp.]|nr:hypothetical protein [Rhizomicrobium sp.]